MFSPEQTKIESLKIELCFAKTIIADLENQKNDRENSLKIYKQKVKLLEYQRSDFYHESYFSTSVTAPTFPLKQSYLFVYMPAPSTSRQNF